MHTKNNRLVSNTYPAFLRAFDEVSKGSSIAEDLINVSGYGEFYIALNNLIRDVYDGISCHNTINIYEDGSALLFETYSNEVGFFLLETNKYLLLLDIVENKYHDGRLELVPSSIRNYDIHVKHISIGGKNYKVTNTYNSFLSFGELNRLGINLGLNSIFYERFLQSLNIYSDLEVIIDADRSVEEYYIDDNDNFINTDMIFNYVIIDDLIVVTEYGT